MYKHISFFMLSLLLFAATMLNAQAPQRFNYQAVIRDGSGNIVANTNVDLRLTVRTGSATGTSQYQETKALTTNQFGLVNHAVGSGVVVSGTFAGITWGTATKFLQVEVSISGGPYNDVGTQQLLSVPYALNSLDNNWTKTGNDIRSNNTGNVGIGTSTPVNKLHVVTNSNGFVNFEHPGDGEMTMVLTNGSTAHNAFISHGGWSMGVGRLGLGGDYIGTPTMTLDLTNGNVGIGTTTPTDKLHIVSGGLYFTFESTTNEASLKLIAQGNTAYLTHGGWGSGVDNIAFGGSNHAGPDLIVNLNSGVSGKYFSFISSGGTSDPTLVSNVDNWGILGGSSTRLYQVYASTYYGTNTSIQAISDRSMKQNVMPYENGLNTLMKLKPVSYDFIPEKLYPTEAARAKVDPKDLNNQIGFIAQEIEEVLPGLVRDMKKEDGTVLKTVGYTGLVPVMVEAIQQQQRMIEELKAEIEVLKNK